MDYDWVFTVDGAVQALTDASGEGQLVDGAEVLAQILILNGQDGFLVDEPDEEFFPVCCLAGKVALHGPVVDKGAVPGCPIAAGI